MLDTLFVVLVSTTLGNVKVAFTDRTKAQSFLDSIKLDVPVLAHNGHYIDIYLPICGHKAIEYGRDSECDNMYVPWQTGICGWETPKKAYAEAIDWAQCEEMPIMYNDLMLPYLVQSNNDIHLA